MARHFKPKSGGPLKKKYIIMIIFLFLLVIGVTGFIFVEMNLEPALKDIANVYVKQLATLAINDAISKKINDEMTELDQLYTVEKNDRGEIELLSYDQGKQAEILTMVTDRTNQILVELSKEPITLPLGQALDSNILAQLGPEIPITLVPIGYAKADIYVDMEEAGINTVNVVAHLVIEADVQIVIPFSSEEAVVTTELPISVVTLPGEVPDFYFQGGDGERGHGTPLPNISVPTGDES